MKSKSLKTELEQFRLPPELAERFRERCATIGKPRSHVLRRLVEKWLRKTDEIIRLRGE